MALRVKCKCGKVLQVSSKLADKRVSCTGCGRAFVLPRARFEALAKPPSSPAASSTGQSVSRSAPPVAPAPREPASDLDRLNSERANLGLDLEVADLSGSISPMNLNDEPLELSLAGDGPLVETPPPPPPVPEAAELEYARDPRMRSKSVGKPGMDEVQGPSRGFWSDAVQSFIYPFRSASNLITFVIICIVSLMRIPLGYAGILGASGSLIIYGWLSAMYLSVVQETAVGSEEMPGIKMEEGFIDDVIKPALKYLGAYLCAIGPFVAYAILLFSGVLPQWMESPFALLAWMGGGFFLWPIFVLLFSFSAIGMIFRIDLIFTTIFRTFVPYISIWLMILLVGFLWTLPLTAMVIAVVGLDMEIPELGGTGLAFSAFYNVLDVVLTIITMRLIGLYYLHFKSRFTLEFE